MSIRRRSRDWRWTGREGVYESIDAGLIFGCLGDIPSPSKKREERLPGGLPWSLSLWSRTSR